MAAAGKCPRSQTTAFMLEDHRVPPRVAAVEAASRRTARCQSHRARRHHRCRLSSSGAKTVRPSRDELEVTNPHGPGATKRVCTVTAVTLRERCPWTLWYSAKRLGGGQRVRLERSLLAGILVTEERHGLRVRSGLPWLAGGCVVAPLSLAAINVWLLVATGNLASDRVLSDEVGGMIAWLAFGLVGAVLTARRPRNPVGRLFVGIGLSMVASTTALLYAQYGVVVSPGSVPLAAEMRYLTAIHVLGLTAMPVALLLFPTGQPPTPGWWRLPMLRPWPTERSETTPDARNVPRTQQRPTRHSDLKARPKHPRRPSNTAVCARRPRPPSRVAQQ